MTIIFRFSLVGFNLVLDWLFTSIKQFQTLSKILTVIAHFYIQIIEATKEVGNPNSERRHIIERLLRVCLGTFDWNPEFIRFLTHNLFLIHSFLIAF